MKTSAKSSAFLLMFVIAAQLTAPAAEPQYLHVKARSSKLSAFWGRPISIEANVLLPDSYYKEPEKRYPVFYWIQGFNGTGDIDVKDELSWQRPMRRLHHEFITIFLDGMFNGGHQEFADSANNGPWGTALTTEFIPLIDATYRTINNPSSRFVGGHSSGGWSALWLQVTYPELFGSEWSVAPDPVDFRYFLGPDLTRSPPQNFYHDSTGHDYHVLYRTLRDLVFGPTGPEQFDSFEKVFSPRGPDGKPEKLFDRQTGIIDPLVEQYWEAHYDIAAILRGRWTSLEPKLRGKLHIIVGTSDTYFLDLPVRLLQHELLGLGSDAEIDFVPGADHFTIFSWRGDLIDYIVTEAASSQ